MRSHWWSIVHSDIVLMSSHVYQANVTLLPVADPGFGKGGDNVYNIGCC